MSGLAYRPEIDGLRAVAVASVVLYHADPTLLPGGFVGVDIFFVISGYLITAILLGQWRDTGRIDLPGFYARRLRRLMPAMWLVVAACMVPAYLLLSPIGGQWPQLAESAAASILYLANFYFQANSGGYFDGPADHLPFLHLWSLAVEEQFYLVHPVLLVVALRVFPRRIPWLLALLAAASLALAELWLQSWPQWAFYQMPARFWELAVGGLVAAQPVSASARPASRWLAPTGLALLAYAIVATSEAHFPGLGALPAVAGACLVVQAVHRRQDLGLAGRLLSARPMVALGLVSYSLYLWHWPLLAIDSAVHLAPSPPYVRFGLCLLALLLAALTHRFVELPWRRGPAPVRRVLLRGGMATAAMVAGVLALGQLTPPPDERSSLMARTRQDRPANMGECHHGVSSRVTTLKPASCHSVPGQPAQVMLWGDSHALAWQPFAWELARAKGLVAASHTMDACSPVFGFAIEQADVPAHRESCLRFNALVRETLATGTVDTLVIAARWPMRFGGDMLSRPERERRTRLRLAGADGTQEEMARALEATLREVAGEVRQVILLAPTPVLKYEAAPCIGSRRPQDCESTRAEFDALAAAARRVLRSASAGLDNVAIVDPADYFCTAQTCPVLKDGYALYWDDDHVSSTAAKKFTLALLATAPAWAAGPAPPPDAPGRARRE